MPELPRDPRQLARDILAGKISIEELAREQQRRRAAAGGGGAMGGQPMPQAKVPDRVPLPKLTSSSAQSSPPRAPRTLARPTPSRPQPQKSLPSRPAPTRPGGPNIDRRPAPRLTQPPTPPNGTPPKPAIPQDNAYAAPAGIQDAVERPTPNIRFDVRSLAHNRAALRQSVLMAEILAKPLSLRQGF